MSILLKYWVTIAINSNEVTILNCLFTEDSINYILTEDELYYLMYE